jgi:hypothetical protein
VSHTRSTSEVSNQLPDIDSLSLRDDSEEMIGEIYSDDSEEMIGEIYDEEEWARHNEEKQNPQPVSVKRAKTDNVIKEREPQWKENQPPVTTRFSGLYGKRAGENNENDNNTLPGRMQLRRKGR